MKKILKKTIMAILSAALVCTTVPARINSTTVSAKKANSKAESDSKISVKASTKTLYIGWTDKKKTASLKVKLGSKNASNKVNYSSSNTKVIKVSSKGKVTAVKAGSAAVIVTSKADRKISTKVKFTVKNYNMAFSSKTASVTLNGTSDTTKKQLRLYGTEKNIKYTSSNEEVATVNDTGKVTAKKIGQTVIKAVSDSGKEAECTVKVKRPDFAIHDPSVYRDPVSGKYYTFGSHLMAAVSTNLIGWSIAADSGSNYTSKSKLFTKNYTKEFSDAYAFTMPDGANQNAWAPDIIYNTYMKKYCMYISIVDGSTKCCIAMAVSDNPDGPYKYQDMIVCSGFETDGSDIGKTNLAKALGMTDEQARESKYAKLGNNSPDCIDATVFYDDKDNLWMVYGSFTTTGGIRLLKLDEKTGLRGENYADSGDGTDNSLSTDDPYYGKKIANSNGEGPYIQMIANKNSPTGYYYYLWTSVGNLQNYGGYNMRVVRADNPEGPYYDTKGNEAVKDMQKYALGLRVMDNYKFSFMDTAYVSQGGNSAADDGNGKTFIQFHVRTARSDSYTFHTHQTFANEDGWLVTAPYEYNGETIAESYDASDVIGDYEFIYHRDTFAKTANTNMDYNESQKITLNADGTVTGAYSGTWELNKHYFTINIEGKTYKGVVLEQYEQTLKRKKVMTFTAVGTDNRTVWGSKMHKTDEEAVKYDAGQLEMPEMVSSDFSLETSGLFGTEITWSSDSDAIVVEGEKAVLNKGEKAVSVKLTAKVTKGSSTKEKTFEVRVPKQSIEISRVIQSDKLELPSKLGKLDIVWSSSDVSVISADGKVTQPESGYKAVTLTAVTDDGKESKFEVIVLAENIVSDSIVYEQDYSEMINDAAIATVWTSKDKQNCLYIEADDVNESFIKFAAGNTGSSQGANTEFNAASQADKNYMVEFDVALDAGTRETTEFAITGTDVSYKENDTNKGIESGYILKLSAESNSTQWSVNNSETTFELPFSWVHVKTIVNGDVSKAAVIISDRTDEDKIYYAGEVDINGNGMLNGLYLRWGCIQALVSVDNVKVMK